MSAPATSDVQGAPDALIGALLDQPDVLAPLGYAVLPLPAHAHDQAPEEELDEAIFHELVAH